VILKAADWHFQVDVSLTREKSSRYSQDHCTCSYCQNYYDTVEQTYPDLVKFLSEFGICIHGPIEVMPFEPTLFMACYRVFGRIQNWGYHPLYANGIQVLPECGDDTTFLLWVGEMRLPWVQIIEPQEVISPANYPEFLERMHDVWLFRHGDPCIPS